MVAGHVSWCRGTKVNRSLLGRFMLKWLGGDAVFNVCQNCGCERLKVPLVSLVFLSLLAFGLLPLRVWVLLLIPL